MDALTKCDPGTVGRQSAVKKFYEDLTEQNEEHYAGIELDHQYVTSEIYKLVNTNMTDCEKIVKELDNTHPEIFKLLIRAKVSGIYECENEINNCTISMINNPNLLLNNVHTLLMEEKIETLLNDSCEKENNNEKRQKCQNSNNEIKSDNFIKIPFNEQAQKFSNLVKRLKVTYLDDVYMKLSETNAKCSKQLEEQCKGINLKI